MTLKELKQFISRLPEEMDNFELVNGEVGYLDPEDDESMVYRADKPIITVYVDKESNEICLLHQTKEEIDNIFKSNDDGNS